MTLPKNILNIAVSVVVLAVVILVAVKYCNPQKKYTQTDVNKILSKDSAAKAAYEDSLEYVRGQLYLYERELERRTAGIMRLEYEIDVLTAKHNVTKTKIKPANNWPTADSNFAMLVPTEYVDECETCFNKLNVYKQENIQLRFERDAYDTLMRQQIQIQDNRVRELEGEKLVFNKLFNDCSRQLADKCAVTRKVKLSVMGMTNNVFTPQGGGPGIIYEDKKYNEFGGHVIFTSAGNLYLIHAAKTISFTRKK